MFIKFSLKQEGGLASPFLLRKSREKALSFVADVELFPFSYFLSLHLFQA